MFVNIGMTRPRPKKLGRKLKKSKKTVIQTRASLPKPIQPAIALTPIPYQTPLAPPQRVFQPRERAFYVPPEEPTQDWEEQEALPILPSDHIEQEWVQEEIPEEIYENGQMEGLGFDWGGLIKGAGTTLQSGLKTGADIFTSAMQTKQIQAQQKLAEAQQKAALAAAKLQQTQAEAKKPKLSLQTILMVAIPVGAFAFFMFGKKRKR